ncbi:hypothetical protein [Flavobacterium sp. 3HN19-14]|uniref:hypothetical protein n=1 Tax=Flavobacterium sp. 3HN19-14 TaxID=3448133 RepID=UPI003EE338C0
MRLIPHNKVILLPELTADEVSALLSNNIQTEFHSFLSDKSRYFDGTIHDYKFGIQKNVVYLRSITPQINGEIISNDGQSIVTLIFKVPYRTMIGFCITILICIAFSIIFLLGGKSSNVNFTVPLGLLVFTYFVDIYFFNLESRQALAFIKKILKIEK